MIDEGYDDVQEESDDDDDIDKYKDDGCIWILFITCDKLDDSLVIAS